MEGPLSDESDNIDLDRAVFGLLRTHGRQADRECEKLLQVAEERGDHKAAALWRTVLEAIRKAEP